jgi:hypothetical protein
LKCSSLERHQIGAETAASVPYDSAIKPKQQKKAIATVARGPRGAERVRRSTEAMRTRSPRVRGAIIPRALSMSFT